MADTIYTTSDTGWQPYYVEDTAGKDILNGKKVTKLYFKVVTTYSLQNNKPVPNSAVSDLYYTTFPGGAGEVVAQKIPGQNWDIDNTKLGLTHTLWFGELNNLLRTPLGGFINHKDKPNCVIKGKVMRYLYTLEDIKAGEELTVKYTMYEV